MTKSPSITKLSTALLHFRLIVMPVKKDSVNPHFKNEYASLDQIIETIEAPLQETGLTYAQFPDGNGLTTILMHPESGEWIEATYSVPLSKNDPQGAGSALTYMRRYALGAVLGLATEEDDDGEVASKTTFAAIKTPSLQNQGLKQKGGNVVERNDEPFPSKEEGADPDAIDQAFADFDKEKTADVSLDSITW